MAIQLSSLSTVSSTSIPTKFSSSSSNSDHNEPADHIALVPKDLSPSKDSHPSSNSNPSQHEESDYIVIFDQHSAKSKRDLHTKWISEHIQKRSLDGSNNGIKGFFHNNEKDSNEPIKGYYGSFSNDDIQLIKNSDEVALVERDSYDTIQEEFIYIQYTTPWGLGRISHKQYENDAGLDNANYVFSYQGGANTTIYILDSGIRADHSEFDGRVRWGQNFVDNDQDDKLGHGTHIAGIAGGHNVGVAKFANIVAVKVIDSTRRASISNIIQGVQWIINDHNSNPGQKSVINYSAVGVLSDARSQAIQAAVDAGIMVVTAAGNSADDACNSGPADMAQNVTGVISVAALNYTNTPASFSNYGRCVSVYAPGVSILSSSNVSDSSYMYMSGTSMSSPFVAGLVSYFWSISPDSSLSDITDKISNYNNDQVKDNLSGTVNKIAYNHL